MLAALALGCALWPNARVYAAGDAPAAVRLAPRIAEGSPARDPAGEFYRATLVVEIGGGAVWLAANPDGSGTLCTDDQAELTVLRPDGTARVWTHDFRDPATGAVRATGPQDVSALFMRGWHTVTLALRDILPPAHSSTSYYLVIFPAAPPAATISPLMSPSNTATPAATATLPPAVTRRAVGTPFAVPTLTPVAVVASPTAAPEATRVSPGAALAVSAAPQDEEAHAPRLYIVVGALLALLAGGIVLRRRRRTHADALFGIASVYDLVSGERCERIDLTQYRRSAAVTVQPLRIAPLSAAGAPYALLYREGDAMCCRLAGVENAAPVTLQDTDEVRLGSRIVLEFRAPARWRSR